MKLVATPLRAFRSCQHSNFVFSLMKYTSFSTETSLQSQSESTEMKTKVTVSIPKEKATPDRKKIVVFGGSGFVGQAMICEALRLGLDVVSINRKGAPIDFSPPRHYTGTVDWIDGDLFQPEGWKNILHGADGAISCVGAFGSNEFMEKINGDANITAVQECTKAGVPRFVYVSAIENNLPDFFLRGYFHGKRRTEQVVKETYENNGFILRPSMIYGTRIVYLPKTLLGFIPNPILSEIKIPLWVIGKPLEFLFSFAFMKTLRHSIPGMLGLLAPPISVETVAQVGLAAATGDPATINKKVGGILTIEDMFSFKHQKQS